jgi:hypothetical protein
VGNPTEYSADTGAGDTEDAEREQMIDDVPMLPVVSYEYDLFSDQRASLGFSNLMASFVSNGYNIRSADTGAIH